MFESPMIEQQTGKMSILDFIAEAVELFIDCHYTGQINGSGDLHMDLFALAAKYDVPKLKSACERILLASINKTNA